MSSPFELTVSKQRAWWIVLILVALAGVGFVLYGTVLGIGVTPDSTVYIYRARDWLSHLGFHFNVGKMNTLEAPGYSMLLAVGSLTLAGQDPFTVARGLGALLLALNIILVARILHAVLPRSFWLSLLGGWFVLTSVDLLTVHTMAWSEPSFLFFSLLGLFMLGAYLERPRTWRLLLAAGLCAASWLVRFIGGALLVTGVLAILLWDTRAWFKRVRAMLVFGILTIAPIAIWSLRYPTQHNIAFHWLKPGWFQLGMTTVTDWFLPEQVSAQPVALGLETIALVCIIVFVVLFLRRGSQQSAFQARSNSKLPRLLTLYLICYALAFVVATLFVDANLMLDARTFAPIFPIVLILLLYLIGRASSFVTFKTPQKIMLGGAALAMGAVYFIAGLTWLVQTHDAGQGYTSRAWAQSEILHQVRALPPTITIYSNGDDAITFLTSRPASRLPDQIAADTLRANPDYISDMQKIGERLESDSVLVYLRGFDSRWFLPSEADLLAMWNLQPIVRVSDGTIYRRVP